MTTLDDMSREAGWYDRRYIPMEARIKEMEDERDRLREALEELTATCEYNHRIAHIGWSYDKYEFAYETQVSNPVKRARATLDKIKAREAE